MTWIQRIAQDAIVRGRVACKVCNPIICQTYYECPHVPSWFTTAIEALDAIDAMECVE